MSKRLRTTDLNICIYHYFAIKIIQNDILFDFFVVNYCVTTALHHTKV